MDWQASCVAVIPCLNEARAIADVVKAVGRLVPTVFVIDDGSRDDTAAVAKSAGAEVIRNNTP